MDKFLSQIYVSQLISWVKMVNTIMFVTFVILCVKISAFAQSSREEEDEWVAAMDVKGDNHKELSKENSGIAYVPVDTMSADGALQYIQIHYEPPVFAWVKIQDVLTLKAKNGFKLKAAQVSINYTKAGSVAVNPLFDPSIKIFGDNEKSPEVTSVKTTVNVGNDTKNDKEDASSAIPWYNENSVFGKFLIFLYISIYSSSWAYDTIVIESAFRIMNRVSKLNVHCFLGLSPLDRTKTL